MLVRKATQSCPVADPFPAVMNPIEPAVAINEQTHAVWDGLTVIESSWRRELMNGFPSADQRVVEVVLPLVKVLHGGHHRAVAQLFEIGHVDLKSAPLARCIAGSPARHDHGVVVVEMRAGHP